MRRVACTLAAFVFVGCGGSGNPAGSIGTPGAGGGPVPGGVGVPTIGGGGTNGGSGACKETLGLHGPEILASGEDRPIGIAVFGDRVYWTDGNVGLVKSVRVSGGPVSIVPGASPGALAIAADDSGVYWEEAEIGGRILRAPTSADAPPSVLAVNATGQPGSLAIDPDTVYWTLAGQNGPPTGVAMIPKTGGVTTVILSPDNIGMPSALVVDASDIFWGNGGAGTIWWARKGGSPVELATGQYPVQLALDSDYLYWTNDNNGPAGGDSVRRMPRGGGDVVEIASGLTNPNAIAIDCEYVFWLDQGIGLRAVPKKGGDVLTLASVAATWYAFSLATDANDLYWVTYDGFVMRMKKSN